METVHIPKQRRHVIAVEPIHDLGMFWARFVNAQILDLGKGVENCGLRGEVASGMQVRKAPGQYGARKDEANRFR